MYIYFFSPVSGIYLKKSFVCYVTISCNDKNYKLKIYKRSRETSFKKRYGNHEKQLNPAFYKNDTILSTYMGTLITTK